MSLRETTAKYKGPLEKMKIIPLNGDLSTPLPLTGGSLTSLAAYSGIGPWDFSGASSTAAVEFKIKIQETEDAVTTIDVSTGTGGVTDESAVTATELAASITAASYTGVTASVDSRGYVEIDVDIPGTDKYIQVYGEGAVIAEFGQGATGGLAFIDVDTQQSFSLSPTLKDAETLTVTDANGLDTEIIVDSYRKGATSALVDTAIDYYLRALAEGGSYDDTNDFYIVPSSVDQKKYFAIEALFPLYRKGVNKEADKYGYLLVRVYSAVAEYGDEAGDRNFQTPTYNITATEYKDPSTGTIYGDSSEQEFTKAAWEAIGWDSI